MISRTLFRRGVSTAKICKHWPLQQQIGQSSIASCSFLQCSLPPSSYSNVSLVHCSSTYNRDNLVDVQGNSRETLDISCKTLSEIKPKRYGKLQSLRAGVLDLDEVVEFLREEGAVDIAVIKVPDDMCYVDYFIIATASSPRHLISIAEMTNKLYKQKRKSGQPFIVIEGRRTSENWQCLDVGDMVIHIMLEETREEYRLEKLWLLGQKYDDMLHEAPSDAEILKTLSMEGLNLMSMDENTAKALGNLDISNPWANEPEDFFDQGDMFESQHHEFGDKVQTKQKDELKDDDAFLV